MARNKYPEITIEKILDVSKRLFLEKGYENTTIQDIVNELGGLTKGAIYHHFKSKEEIINALGDKLFFENNPFEVVQNRTDLNGLQKMQEVIKVNQLNTEQMNFSKQMLPTIRNPRILAETMQGNQNVLAPYWKQLIEEGNRDGSVHTDYAEELADLLPFLTNLWLIPFDYPMEVEKIRKRVYFLADMLNRIGVPLIDDEIKELLEQYLNKL